MVGTDLREDARVDRSQDLPLSLLHDPIGQVEAFDQRSEPLTLLLGDPLIPGRPTEGFPVDVGAGGGHVYRAETEQVAEPAEILDLVIRQQIVSREGHEHHGVQLPESRARLVKLNAILAEDVSRASGLRSRIGIAATRLCSFR
jgi:hypothetical protein